MIDPLFASNVDLLTSFGTIYAESVSDHRIRYCQLQLINKVREPKIVRYRYFGNFSFDEFHNDLYGLAWNNIFKEHCIDSQINMLNDLYCNYLTGMHHLSRDGLPSQRLHG